ncbi:MAG TPA: hypothetical protein PLQ56_27370 [Aggregatilineales bacterium]|nr:hypothetical protein [Aggregatilineales bacterium]
MEFKNGTNEFQTLIIGAGPAGIGPIINAMQYGHLGNLLETGVCLVDRSNHIGRGAIGQYIINSDTYCNTFFECLEKDQNPVVERTRLSPAYHALETYRGGPAPLQLVGDFMAALGDSLRIAIDEHPVSQFIPEAIAQDIQILSDGRFRVRFVSHAPGSSDERFEIVARNLVTAMGASQSVERTLAAEIIPGLSLADSYAEKCLLTGIALARGGPKEIERRLNGSAKRKVVIIGASHSTTSSAWVLLNKVNLEFRSGDITILHREPFRIFYPTRQAALDDGYVDFTDDDFCPLTGRLYRLAGLRFDSRDLMKSLMGIGGASPETRVRLVPLDRTGKNNTVDVKVLLDEAALVIPAFGYRPNTLPVTDENENTIALFGNGPGTPPLVDDRCRVLGVNGQPIPNFYGIGLASGFMLTGKLGGEPSFRGQTNGLWLYQNGVGELITQAILM